MSAEVMQFKTINVGRGYVINVGRGYVRNDKGRHRAARAAKKNFPKKKKPFCNFEF